MGISFLKNLPLAKTLVLTLISFLLVVLSLFLLSKLSNQVFAWDNTCHSYPSCDGDIFSGNWSCPEYGNGCICNYHYTCMDGGGFCDINSVAEVWVHDCQPAYSQGSYYGQSSYYGQGGYYSQSSYGGGTCWGNTCTGATWFNQGQTTCDGTNNGLWQCRSDGGWDYVGSCSCGGYSQSSYGSYSQSSYSYSQSSYCSNSGPSAPTLVSPADGAVFNISGSSTNVSLDWNAPSSWGTDCNGASNYYQVYVEQNDTTPDQLAGSPSASALTVNNLTTGTWYWRVRAHNGSVSGSYSSVRSFTITASDFTLSVVPSSQSVAQGNSVSYAVNLTAQGSFNQTVTLSSNLSGTGISYYFNPCGTATCGVLVPGGSATLVVTTSTSTPVATYPFTVTGTPTSGTAKSQAVSLVVTLAPANPWVKAEKGNVASQGSITMPTAAPSGQVNADYLIISAAASVVTNFSSAKGWLLQQYSPLALPQPKVYQELFDKFSGSSLCQINTSSGALPDERGVFKIGDAISGDFSTNGLVSGSAPCSAQNFAKNATIVLVSGNLTVTSNLNYTRPTLFIVQGSIVINPAVTLMNAVFFANGSFSTGTGGTSNDSQLVINGGVMAANSGSGQFNLQRNLGSNNTTTPSERFVFQPKYLYILSDYVGTSRTVYSEENP